MARARLLDRRAALIVDALVLPATLAAQAGDCELHPVHRGSAEPSDRDNLSIYVGDQSNLRRQFPSRDCAG